MENNENSVNSAKDIANYFLCKDNHGIDNLKINKLVYIALGYSLAFNDRDIYPEPIEAWEYGPVISTLYHTYKKFGAKAIDQYTGKPNHIDDEVQTTLSQVWNTYISERGVDLITLTHKPHTPWSLYYKPNQNNIIQRPTIKQYYSLILGVS